MRPQPRVAAAAAAAYVVLALAWTWPLARTPATGVPSDLGDPLLNMWILAWDARRPLDFNAPIFAPHPLALAYSDHLTSDAALVWPVLAASGNPILAYNALFVATFAASAFAMFLMIRAFTDDAAAAFVAGLAFGYAPYRVSALPHIQVLSSMWMPAVVLAFRRWFETSRARYLAGAAFCWTAQNLASGYYLLFFSPAVVLYLMWELAVRGSWRDRRTLVSLGAAIAAVVVATAPFLVPYYEVRQLGFNPRSIRETQRYAADVYAYFTAPSGLRLWGGLLRAWPQPEGALFPGVTIVALAIVALVAAWRRARRSSRGADDRAIVARLAGGIGALGAVLIVLLLLGWSMRGAVRITSIDRVLLVTVGALAACLVASPAARARARQVSRSPVAAFGAIALFATVMSFGPSIVARGHVVEQTSLYALVYDHVPGFDGLRVPARFGMIVVFGLAALAGFGVASVERARRWLAAGASVLILAESWAAPIPMNQSDSHYAQHDLAPLPPRVALGDSAPPVYAFVRTLPASAVLLELPLGEPAFDVRYMFQAIEHRRALVNGYSGGAPDAYGLLRETLRDVVTRPDAAWQAILRTPATHVIVHENGYLDGRGPEVSGVLRARGAHEVAVFGGDRVFLVR